MNKEYKLIKKYPSLPFDWEVGMIVGTGDRCSPTSFSPCNGKYKDYYVPFDEVVNNDEYWKEEKEKEYEILSFRDKHQRILFRLDDYSGKYVIPDLQVGSYSTWGIELESMLEEGRSVKSGCLEINSIKRLSDGEVFTIGDKVDITNNPKQKNLTIKQFHISNVMTISTLQSVDESYYGKEGFNISIAVHSKPPIFTTQDCVNLYEGDEYYWSSNKIFSNQPAYSIHGPFKITSSSKFGDDVYVFSSKNSAEEWVELTKPKKTPLTKTEDGVDVYEGDEIFWVGVGYYGIKYFYKLAFTKEHLSLDFVNTYKIFSTKELADEFVSQMDSKSFSVNEIIHLLHLGKEGIGKLIKNINRA
jgi:hypothetical protein